MNNNLLIIGAGGHGRVVKETVEELKLYDKIDFLDDNSEQAIGKCEAFKNFIGEYKYAFVALGNAELRSKWLELLSMSFEIPTIIHPTAYISPSVKLEAGCYIGAKAVVNSRAVIKKGCIIGIGALVDHDCMVGEYSYITPGVVIKAGSIINRFTKTV